MAVRRWSLGRVSTNIGDFNRRGQRHYSALAFSCAAEQARLLALLRRVRREAGLTQVDLARRIGEEQTFVSKFERGERRLDILELRHICQALGLPLDAFALRLERELATPRDDDSTPAASGV